MTVNIGGFEITVEGKVEGEGIVETNQRAQDLLPGEVFDLSIDVSPCQFSVYDSNQDWQITSDEMHAIVPDNIADRLFRDLDSTGDVLITMEEFLLAPKIIKGTGCDPDGLPVDFKYMKIN